MSKISDLGDSSVTFASENTTAERFYALNLCDEQNKGEDLCFNSECIPNVEVLSSSL